MSGKADKKLGTSILEQLWFGEDDALATDDEAATHFAAFLGDVEGLRPFPIVVQKVLAYMSQPNFDVRTLQRMIEEDPSLCGKLLRTANSPLFRRRDPCGSVHDAIIRMGARTVTEIVASVGAMTMLSDSSGAGKAVRDHCAGTAAIVRTLAGHRDVAAGTGFLCGLMHDIGKLLLLQSDEDDYAKLGGIIAGEPDRIHLEERRLLGFDHAVLGGHVLSTWQLPAPVPQVVAWHHQPVRAYAERTEVSQLVALLRLADQLDAFMRSDVEPQGAEMERIAATPDAVFAGFRAKELTTLWKDLKDARVEALALFH